MDEKSGKKKAWIRPDLVVLVRNMPEEAVLTGCKNGPIYTVSANDYWGGCYAFGPYNPCPNICNALQAS
jgi:hypothetical protein